MNIFTRILDFFGWKSSPSASVLIDATRPGDQRPTQPIQAEDVMKMVSSYDLKQLLSYSRKLFLNFGPAKGAIIDKAVYSVGRAWRPRFLGKDKAWGKKAAAYLRNQWYGSCDIAGGMHDFVTDLLLMSIAIDRDGDIGILLVKTPTGWPMLQLIEGHRIASNYDGEVLDGSFQGRGLTLNKGVFYDAFKRPVAYRIRGENMTDFRDVSARDFIHVYDPEWFNQGRGLPALTHGILDLMDLMTTQENEKKAIMIASSIGLIETNETGNFNPKDPKNLGKEAPKGTGPVEQSFWGGLIKYIKAGVGAKLESFFYSRPGADVQAFMDRLIHNFCTGLGWPYALLWSAKDVRGANIRSEVARAARTIEDRQDLLRAVAKRIVGWSIASAIKTGILDTNDEWWMWDFTMPAHITCDAGREADKDRDDYRAGIINLTDLLARQGKDLEEHLRERAEEEKLIKEIAQEHGVEPEKLRDLSSGGSPPAKTQDAGSGGTSGND